MNPLNDQDQVLRLQCFGIAEGVTLTDRLREADRIYRWVTGADDDKNKMPG